MTVGGSLYVHPMAGVNERWNPWRALRECGAVLFWNRMEGDDALAGVLPDGTEVVVLDPRLRPRTRRAALGHELVHLERGILPFGTPRSIVAREEYQVNEETARRLVPIDELAAFVARGGAITEQEVADEFDVPVAVASRALAQLRHPRSAGLRQQFDIEEGAA